MAAKKKSTPKTPFEKIGAAYESEAKRQEKNQNPEMAARTRQAAAKSMTKENQQAYEEDTQSAKESKVASKKSKLKGTAVAEKSKLKGTAVDKPKDDAEKSKLKGTAVDKPKDDAKKSKLKGTAVDKSKADAVGAAGAKAKDAVSAAVERNPVSGPPSPAGDKENTGSGKDTQRTPKPSSKLRGTMSPKGEEDGTPADGDAYAKSDEGKAERAKGNAAGRKSPLRAGPEGTSGMSKGSKYEAPGTPADGDAYAQSEEGRAERAKGNAAGRKSPLRAGPEGTSGMSKGTKGKKDDITKEMPATARDKDAERMGRIKELSGVSTDPSDKGKMPDAPPSRTKPTVLITPSDKGKMPDPDKPGLMSRLRGRVKSFSSPAAGGAPPTPSTPSTPSGGGYPDAPKAEPKAEPAAEPTASQTQETKDGTKQTQSAPATSSGITFAPQAGGNVVQNSQYSEKGDNSKDVSQTINGNGQPITATTSGKATSSGGRGITASTSGTATSHPRAANASRGARPTSKKK